MDLVIDPVGSTLQTSLSALALEGRLVFLGNVGGGKLEVDLWQPMQSNQTLHGVFMRPLLGDRPSIELSTTSSKLPPWDRSKSSSTAPSLSGTRRWRTTMPKRASR